jgi:hypothetical protein
MNDRGLSFLRSPDPGFDHGCGEFLQETKSKGNKKKSHATLYSFNGKIRLN